MEQRTDFALSPFQGELLQAAGKREEKEQRRSFTPFSKTRCPGSHCQHQKMHI
jgi:hypothetical protein